MYVHMAASHTTSNFMDQTEYWSWTAFASSASASASVAYQAEFSSGPSASSMQHFAAPVLLTVVP